MIDFGGPNIAKPMAVHHLRSSIIGDLLQRLFRALGWRVTSDVHLGDWGLQMGQLIAELALRQPDLPYFDPADKSPYPEQSPVSMEELEQLYPESRRGLQKLIRARLDAARLATAELQDGRPGYRALWRHFPRRVGGGVEARIRQSRRRVRRMERRIRRRSPDPAADRETESASISRLWTRAR